MVQRWIYQNPGDWTFSFYRAACNADAV